LSASLFCLTEKRYKKRKPGRTLARAERYAYSLCNGTPMRLLILMSVFGTRSIKSDSSQPRASQIRIILTVICVFVWKMLENNEMRYFRQRNEKSLDR